MKSKACVNCAFYKEHRLARAIPPKPTIKKFFWWSYEVPPSEWDLISYRIWENSGWCTINPEWTQQDFNHYCSKFEAKARAMRGEG